MKIQNVAVIGAGTMGNGIAHVFAQYGFKTFLLDLNKDILDKAINNISSNIDRQIKKGILSDNDKNNILNNISLINSLDLIPKDIDLVIEAIIENKEAKKSLFEDLEKLINPNCIFASNSSSISITEMASVSRPEKFIGMHFMNPVPVMKLVEIIRGHLTSNNTYNMIKEICMILEKVPVEVNDSPGFISNRILMPMINEAIFALYEKVANVEDIDNVMKLGMNHPMGPLQLADFIGLDVCLKIMEVLYEGFNDSKYRPCPLLKKMVAAGNLGRKARKGFYTYS